MASEDNKRVIQQFIEEVINRKNLNVLDTIVAEDFIEHIPFPGQGPGREGLRDAVAGFHAAFPDGHWTIDEQIAEGSKVVTRFTMTGTHQGEFLGIPATGKSVKVWGTVIDVVRDGIFSESRILLDAISLMMQLGAIPPPGEPA